MVVDVVDRDTRPKLRGEYGMSGQEGVDRRSVPLSISSNALLERPLVRPYPWGQVRRVVGETSSSSVPRWSVLPLRLTSPRLLLPLDA